MTDEQARQKVRERHPAAFKSAKGTVWSEHGITKIRLGKTWQEAELNCQPNPTLSSVRRCLNCDGVYGDHWGPENQCREGSQDTWRYVHPSVLPDSDDESAPSVGMDSVRPEPAANCPILVGHLNNLNNHGGKRAALVLALVGILDDVEAIAALMDHPYPADRHAIERARHIAECVTRMQALIPDIN